MILLYYIPGSSRYLKFLPFGRVFVGEKAQFFFTVGRSRDIQNIQTFVSQKVFSLQSLGVSKNRGTPKWMVYNGKHYENMKMDDLGENHLFLETPQSCHCNSFHFPPFSDATGCRSIIVQEES